ncbi:saccharopine dehydrogenase family protein [Limoniibacter endophyticus]|uniref:Dehydrogenase n=1 Tax=Limoniibacter endophyticus TaxID=1565040 RepID=A0A8J3GHT5_9HYPH|nr:saccharopine dehydrogenase NADP-binding domain-containing protein [Limoniibacter endophyticus]GHC76891.1 dehydrogenase [Limoniibacter endophyticus]
MKQIVVVGAGKIGTTIARFLSGTGDYAVTLVDCEAAQIEAIKQTSLLRTAVVDVTNEAALGQMLSGKFAVLSAAPFFLTTLIARAAAAAGVHYLDLTEDVRSTREVIEMSKTAKSAFVPQCGLAPGFVSIVTSDLAKRFDSLDTLKLRVGALPQFPTNALGYNLTWSTDGVINEYIEPCEAIVEGKRMLVPALEEREEILLDGVKYEAFNTSGGLGSLCETFEGKVRTLNYRTMRYPGHCAVMKMLLQDLDLRNRRPVMKDILEHALPATGQDVVLVVVTATGYRNGRLIEESHISDVKNGEIFGEDFSAIQITTAAGICTVLDLLVGGKLPQSGFIKQEEILLSDFRKNRFGGLYWGEGTLDAKRPAAVA